MKQLCRRLTALLLCITMLAGCAGEPLTTKPSSSSPSSAAKTTEAPTESTKATEPTASPTEPADPYDGKEYSGSSNAVDVTPCEGVHVTAEAGAFDEDPVIVFTPAADDTDKVRQLSDELLEDDTVLLYGYEVDMGLADDEIIPGEYRVEIDLSSTGIDAALYDTLTVWRFGDDGSRYELTATVRDGVLSFSACQNSLVGIAAIGTAAACLLAYSDFAHHEYFYMHAGKYCRKDYSNAYGSYYIEWFMEDVELKYKDKVARMAEIEKQYRKEAWDYAQKQVKESAWRAYLRDQIYLEYYREKLSGDSEYKKLKQETTVPDAINKAHLAIDKAYEYLAVEEDLRMPLYKVPFEVTNTTDFGTARGVEFTHSFIEMELYYKVFFGGQGAWENFQLTMVHELFHICQNRYRLPVDMITDSVRYDEMAALFCETKAYHYFKDKGEFKYLTEDDITEADHWGTMRLPANGEEDKKANKGQLNQLLILEGYTIGGFLNYLVDKVKAGGTVKCHELMKQREFFSTATVSGPLCKVLEITEAEFDIHWRNYFISKRYEIGEKLSSVEKFQLYQKLARVQVAENGKAHVDIEHGPGYFMTIRTFEQSGSKALPALMVTDPDAKNVFPHIIIGPGLKYKTISKGAYIYSFGVYSSKKEENKLLLPVVEVHGDGKEDKTDANAGYTIYLLGQPSRPQLRQKEDVLVITLPAVSAAAKDGMIDGYLLKLETSEGLKLEREIAPEFFEKDYIIPLADLTGRGQNDKKPSSVKLTLAEYILNEKDGQTEKLTGPESEVFEAALKEEEAPTDPLEAFSGNWIPAKAESINAETPALILSWIAVRQTLRYMSGTLKTCLAQTGTWAEIRDYVYDADNKQLTFTADGHETVIALNDKGNLSVTVFSTEIPQLNPFEILPGAVWGEDEYGNPVIIKYGVPEEYVRYCEP